MQLIQTSTNIDSSSKTTLNDVNTENSTGHVRRIIGALEKYAPPATDISINDLTDNTTTVACREGDHVCYGTVRRICYLTAMGLHSYGSDPSQVTDINTRLRRHAKAFEVSDLDKIPRYGDFAELRLDVRSQACFICDAEGMLSLQVNSKVSQAMAAVHGLEDIVFDVYANYDELVELIQRAHPQEEGANLVVHAVLCGPESKGDTVGDLLGSYEIFLQDPLFRIVDMPYTNPQAITFSDVSELDIWCQEFLQTALTQDGKVGGRDWSTVLNKLPQHQASYQPTENVHINTPLFPYVLFCRKCAETKAS